MKSCSTPPSSFRSASDMMAFARSPLKEQSLAFNDFELDTLYGPLEAALDASNAELMPFIKAEPADTDMKATIASQADQAH